MLGENIPAILEPISPTEGLMKDYREAFNDTVIYLL